MGVVFQRLQPNSKRFSKLPENFHDKVTVFLSLGFQCFQIRACTHHENSGKNFGNWRGEFL